MCQFVRKWCRIWAKLKGLQAAEIYFGIIGSLLCVDDRPSGAAIKQLICTRICSNEHASLTGGKKREEKMAVGYTQAGLNLQNKKNKYGNPKRPHTIMPTFCSSFAEYTAAVICTMPIKPQWEYYLPISTENNPQPIHGVLTIRTCEKFSVRSKEQVSKFASKILYALLVGPTTWGTVQWPMHTIAHVT